MLILASASPRRRELLTQIGIAHTVHPAHIDETQLAGESALTYVRRLALEKARVVHQQQLGATVLAADTTVVLEGKILGKPADRADAECMLLALAGREHTVYTGIAVVSATTEIADVEATTVKMCSIPAAELAAYLDSGDSLDKAGAYGIQGYAGRWINGIEGDFFNVVGLPLAATVRLLRDAGEI